MGSFLGIVVVGAVALGAVLHFVAHTSTAVLLGLGAGTVCLLWLAALVTVPWDLYLRARTTHQDLVEGRAAGLDIPEGREREAAGLTRRLLRVALGAHLGSAVVAGSVAAATGHPLWSWAGALCLLSALPRPTEAWLRRQGGRIGRLGEEASFPRESVLALRARLDAAEAGVAALDAETRRLARELDRLAVLVRRRAGARVPEQRTEPGSAQTAEQGAGQRA